VTCSTREELAAIGHERRHAVEVLGDPHVTDYHTMYSFFDRIGSSDQGWFETHAAIQAGRSPILTRPLSK